MIRARARRDTAKKQRIKGQTERSCDQNLEARVDAFLRNKKKTCLG